MFYTSMYRAAYNTSCALSPAININASNTASKVWSIDVTAIDKARCNINTHINPPVAASSLVQ
jgi:hypothetical protein